MRICLLPDQFLWYKLLLWHWLCIERNHPNFEMHWTWLVHPWLRGVIRAAVVLANATFFIVLHRWQYTQTKAKSKTWFYGELDITTWIGVFLATDRSLYRSLFLLFIGAKSEYHERCSVQMAHSIWSDRWSARQWSSLLQIWRFNTHLGWIKWRNSDTG